MIDLQINTTKVVIITQPNYNQKEFAICWNFFQLFTTHQSSKIHFSAHLSHLQRSLCTTWNALELNALNHPTPQHVLFDYHAIQPKKHTCHHAPKQYFHFTTPQNDPNFHPTMLHKIPFVSLCHIEISQTWYLSRANHMLHHKSFKYHTEITFKPFWFTLTCTQTHLKKIPFFHIFCNRPHGSPG